MSLLLIASPIIFGISLAILFLIYKKKSSRLIDIKGKHIIITGGSQGIGREVALLCYRMGAKISLIARDPKKLIDAKNYIIENGGTNEYSKIEVFSADLSSDYSKVKEAINTLEEILDPVFGLFNFVGNATSLRLTETPIDDYSKMINVNYLSAVYCTRAVLESMINQRGGFIQLTSSIAGLFGFYGYTSYSPSKFALLGFAESISMELKPHNISITIAFPPDTDTPGFVEEEHNKPIETKIISKCEKVFSAHSVAERILEDTLSKKFASSIGFEGFFIHTLCSGMMPISSWVEVLFQFLLMGVFRLMGALYLSKFDFIVKRCALQREASKKQT